MGVEMGGRERAAGRKCRFVISEDWFVAGALDVLALPRGAEGGGCFVPPVAAEGARGAAPDTGRAQEEARRRARSKLRWYCAANRLNRFGTLTYASSCRDPLQLRADIGGFFRGLRRELGGERLPYAWTSEWHPGAHGLHVHFAVGRYVRQRLIRDVWGPRDRAHQADR